MNSLDPASLPAQALPNKKGHFAKRFTSRNRDLKHALDSLSKDMQGSLGELTYTIEHIGPGDDLDLAKLKQDLRNQLSRLNEGMSLLGTMLETNSSEILKYVKKRKPGAGAIKNINHRGTGRRSAAKP